jgi:hypothetical protein
VRRARVRVRVLLVLLAISSVQLLLVMLVWIGSRSGCSDSAASDEQQDRGAARGGRGAGCWLVMRVVVVMLWACGVNGLKACSSQLFTPCLFLFARFLGALSVFVCITSCSTRFWPLQQHLSPLATPQPSGARPRLAFSQLSAASPCFPCGAAVINTSLHTAPTLTGTMANAKAPLRSFKEEHPLGARWMGALVLCAAAAPMAGAATTS